MPVTVLACSGESRIASLARHFSHRAGNDPLAVRTISRSWISILSSLLFFMMFLPGVFYGEHGKSA